MTLTYAEFCAGAGGLGLAVEEVFGAELAWYSEFEAAPSKVMAHHWPDAPNHGDMTTIDFAAVEQVDILSGGTPCQDLSHAGRRAGMRTGTRSGLWESMREAIATIKPTYVVWENVRGAYSAGASSEADSEMEPLTGRVGAGDGQSSLRALGRVLGDLADLGFDAEWRGLRAADVGAPHGRFRVFILATRRGTTSGALGFRGHEAVQHDGGDAQGSDGASIPDQSDREPVRIGPKRGHDGRTRGPNGKFAPLVQDADLTTGDQRGIAAPGQTQSRGTRANTRGRSGTPTPDTGSAAEWEHPGEPSTEETRPGSSHGSSDHGGKRPDQERGETPANAKGAERRRAEPDNLGKTAGSTPEPRERAGDNATNWGPYEPAIRRWEAVRGAAPAPTELTPKGKHRLNPRFAEWMMGWPAGWVDLPGVGRNEQLKIIGNGVVPAQCVAALRDMVRSQ